jgi:hypothetical protein
MMNVDFDGDTTLRLLREAEARAVEASSRRHLALEARGKEARMHAVFSHRQSLLAAIRRSFRFPRIRGSLRPVHFASRMQDSPFVPHLVAAQCAGTQSHGRSRCPRQ